MRQQTTAHFVGGPWDGRAEQLDGLPPVWNVLPPSMPTAVFTKDAPLAPEPGEFRHVAYESREVWEWNGVRHARYVVAK